MTLVGEAGSPAVCSYLQAKYAIFREPRLSPELKRLRQFVPNTTCFIPPRVCEQQPTGRRWSLWNTGRPRGEGPTTASPRTPGLFEGDDFFCREIAATQSKELRIYIIAVTIITFTEHSV